METVLEIIQGDVFTERAVMDIAMLVRKCGKVNDIISFAGNRVYIRTSDDESALQYMHTAKDLIDFDLGELVSNKKEHGLNLTYKLKHVALPTMIMKALYFSDSIVFKNVEFDVTAVSDSLRFIVGDFGASFAEEVLK